MEKICNMTFGKDSWSQASLPIRPWRSWPPFCCRPVSAMFPIVVLCLPRPRQQVASLSHIASCHGEVINATDVWSALHDSSPQQKETQSAWDDFSHHHYQCINQCSCPSLASLQWIAIAFRMFVFSVSFNCLQYLFSCFL